MSSGLSVTREAWRRCARIRSRRALGHMAVRRGAGSGEEAAEALGAGRHIAFSFHCTAGRCATATVCKRFAKGGLSQGALGLPRSAGGVRTTRSRRRRPRHIAAAAGGVRVLPQRGLSPASQVAEERTWAPTPTRRTPCTTLGGGIGGEEPAGDDEETRLTAMTREGKAVGQKKWRSDRRADRSSIIG